MAKGKSIFISDFDDTLVKTQARILLTKKDGTKVTLTPAQYAVYEKESGDSFDYSQFDKLIKPEPIPRYVKLLKKAVKSDKVDKVVILTARGNEKPVVKFLHSVGIRSGLKIVALGDSDPNRKKHYIEKQIKNGYTRLVFADDSPKNVEAAKELKGKYPQAAMVVHQAKEPVTDSPKGHTPNLNTIMVVNPTTKRNIKLKSALGYEKTHPAYKAAINTLKSIQSRR